jgi:hypothetical protein
MRFIICTVVTLLIKSSFQYAFLANECKYKLSNGIEVNLDKLRREHDYIFWKDGFTYFANFCGSLSRECDGREIPAAVYTYGENFNNTCIMPLSDSFKIEVDYVNLENISTCLKLNLPEGGVCNMNPNKFYKVYYIIMCDLAEEGNFNDIIQKDDCTYEYYFSSKYGCYNTNYHDQPYADYVMYIIVLSFVFSAYCIGYLILNYKTNLEDGLIKALPHTSFWSSKVTRLIIFIDWLYEIVKKRHS